MSTLTARVTDASGEEATASFDVTVGETTEPTVEPYPYILGPQVPLGASPWPWYDRTLEKDAQEHVDSMLTAPGSTDVNYYDLAYCLYQLYDRSGDPLHAEMADSVALAWWEVMPEKTSWTAGYNPFAIAPRNGSIAGLILYYLRHGDTAPQVFPNENHPESDWESYTLWEWVEAYVKRHFTNWVLRRVDYDGLYYGIRDGGFATLYAAMLAGVHEDETVRIWCRDGVREATVDYYARVQESDGGWYWKVGGVDEPRSQPFMVGLLLEAMILAHELLGDAAIANAVTLGVDWLWDRAYRTDVRGMWYAVPQDPAGEYWGPDGDTDGEKYQIRHLNSTCVHAWGYAYRLTGDEKYRDQGDEIFAATYGAGEGPLADEWHGLAWGRIKEYNQSYRSSGHYLAWSDAPARYP